VQLWDFPQVKVRVSCECGYRTAYKLVRLGELYGARTDVKVVLGAFRTLKCPAWPDAASRTSRCKLQFTDVSEPE
jgi:hypothetical protein